MNKLPLYPGSTLGVLGGGQLGRMFAIEALRMGYHVWVLDPDPASPAGSLATKHVQAAFHDSVALQEFGEACDAITIEFENIPAESVRLLSAMTRVTPDASCIEIAQDRSLEKNFARKHGLSTTLFGDIRDTSDIEGVCEEVGFPSILKTARLGYDGKGQSVCHDMAEVEGAFAAVGGVACVLEKRIDLLRELSVVLSRDDSGLVSFFPVAENRHVDGVLDVTLVPATISQSQDQEARQIAKALAEALNYVGILAVELFVDQNGQLLINEMAPRPHNSGHYTLDACCVSQFELQVRILCGLDAGDLSLKSPTAMLNLLGDSWLPSPPDWGAIYGQPGTHLHLYGKHEARKGRKMGHINVLSDSPGDALEVVQILKKILQH